MEQENRKDVFISHASEDKEAVALPLHDYLVRHGLTVWLDKFELDVGDSLRRSLEHGLRNTQFGVVIVSESFFAPHKTWTERELDCLFTLEKPPARVILPVWHGINEDYLKEKSPFLATKLGTTTARGIEAVGADLLRAIFRNRGLSVPSFVQLRHGGECDPALLKNWLTKLYAGKPEVHLIWPEELTAGMRTISLAAERLVAGSGKPLDVVRVADTGRALRSMEADSLLTAPASLQRAMESIQLRLPALVKGTMAYDGPNYYIHERILRVFLKLSYAWIWEQVSGLLDILDGVQRPRTDFFDQIRNASGTNAPLVRALTMLQPDSSEETLNAKEILGTYNVWAPSHLWPAALAKHDFVGGDLFEIFLVPQTELALAQKNTRAEFTYSPHTERWWFKNFKDEAGEHTWIEAP